MSTTTSNQDATSAIDNGYTVILNKRIRAYKKKVERINALRGKQDLDKEQKELCSHFDVYSAVLNELMNIKSQFAAVTPVCDAAAEKEAELAVPAEVAPVKERLASFDEEKEAPVAEPVEQPVEQPVVEQPVEQPAVEQAEQAEQAEQTEVTEQPAILPAENPEQPALAKPAEEAVETPSPANAEEKQGEKRYRHRGRREEATGRRPYYPRREKFNHRRNGVRGISKKDAEEGWIMPKKVAYVRNEAQE